MAAVATAPRSGGGYLERPKPSGLADVIEILTVDARIVVASVDTYLRFAEAAGRLNLEQADQSEGLPELMESITSGGAESKTKGALEGVKEKLFGDDDDDDSGNGRQRKRSTSRASSSSGSSRSRSASGSTRSRSRASSGNSKK
jgi:gas vesicle structural protein